jgi:surface polysaccharide O-acyltransferase-like enzyme
MMFLSNPGLSAGRVVGIDYLRAVFSVGVVAVHLNYVFPSAIFDPDRYTEHTFTASDFVNFYVLCLAVPAFVLISTFLYARKPTDAAGFGRRLWRIVRLLAFWSLLFQLARFGAMGAVKHVPVPWRDPPAFALYALTGGDSYYYFFVDLLVVTLVTHLAARLSTPAVWGLFAAATLVVGVLPIAHRETGLFFLGLHADPLNFVPFAFAGIGLARLSAAGDDRTLGRVGVGCLVLAAAAALLDWTVYVDPVFFEVNQFAIPAYTRPSLVFLGVAVVVLALRFRWPENAVVRFMATHSLAVYCLHPFFVDGKEKIIQVLHLGPVGATFVPWAVVLGLSYLGSLVVPAFLRPELVR